MLRFFSSLLDCTGLRDRFGAVSPDNPQQAMWLRGTGRGGAGIGPRPGGRGRPRRPFFGHSPWLLVVWRWCQGVSAGER